MNNVELKVMRKASQDSSNPPPTDSNYGSLDNVVVDSKDVRASPIDNPVFVVNGTDVRHRVVGQSSCEEQDDDDDEDLSYFSQKVEEITTTLSSFYQNNYDFLWSTIYIILLILYLTYVGCALAWRFGDEGSIRLLVCTILGLLFISWKLIVNKFGEHLTFNCCMNTGPRATKAFYWVHIAAAISVTVAILIYVIITIAINTPKNLISLGGMVVFILTFYILSAHPSKVKLRPVFWGLAIQFIFALIILRWEIGYRSFKWLGDRMSEFLSYSDEGAKFLFGKEEYKYHFFAFKVMPVIIFFSTAISILYYLGVMQFIIRNIAKFMAKLLGTSAAESLNAAGNIFVGQSESPLMIKPFLEDMTKSELHAILTGGFATIAGSVMAAYILLKVPANHLLSASVMSAPAALAMSKLFYPETEKTVASDELVYNMEKGDERNIIEAASKGAGVAIKLISNIAANLIAFISLLAFVNATLRWFGDRIGFEDPHLSFEFICSYLFWPLAFLMGVDSQDCFKVGELIGIKTFINEFFAYNHLSIYISNVQNLTWYEGLTNNTNLTFWGADSNNLTAKWEHRNGDIFLNDLNITLEKGILTDRSIVITTYALCGFSNIGSMGIMLGALGALAPSRKSDLSRIVVRAMIAGNVACFMTACIAGLLYEGEL